MQFYGNHASTIERLCFLSGVYRVVILKIIGATIGMRVQLYDGQGKRKNLGLWDSIPGNV
jgi:hypothetical protein